MHFLPVDLSKQKFEGDLKSLVGIISPLRSVDANLKMCFSVWFFELLEIQKLDSAAEVSSLQYDGLSHRQFTLKDFLSEKCSFNHILSSKEPFFLE